MKYTGHRERLPEERQQRFINGCREGRTDIAFTATGTNLQLVFGVTAGNYSGDPRECDFNKEQGKVCCAAFPSIFSLLRSSFSRKTKVKALVKQRGRLSGNPASRTEFYDFPAGG